SGAAPPPCTPRAPPVSTMPPPGHDAFRATKVGDPLPALPDAQAPAASIPLLEGQLLQVVLDRVVLSPDGRRRITESLETALVEGEGRATVEVGGQRGGRVSREVRCPSCDGGLARPQPGLFSFHHPLGASP